ATNSVDELKPDVLGYAGEVYCETHDEEKYTYVTKCKNPKACTILIKGPTFYNLQQTKDAVRDGLRAVANVVKDQSIVPGAGAFYIACSEHLKRSVVNKTIKVKGKQKLGVQAFADSLLVIPKILIKNAGHDPLDVLALCQDDLEEIAEEDEEELEEKRYVGVDLNIGDSCDPTIEGIWDSFRVIRNAITGANGISSNLLLCDELLKAGRSTLKQ
ncbi:chaperonin Cpn60/TCP-1, partial [Hanseniaspora valbyensis NRRL Y-1626]